MGTWGVDPFDNDSAADFASDVTECSDAEARHDLLLVTLRAASETLPKERLSDEYSWGYELEHAVASAAFVADAYTGRKDFTDNAFVRGVDDDDELLPFVDIRLSGDLVTAARSFTSAMIERMRVCNIADEWIQPVANVDRALAEQTRPGRQASGN